MRSIKQGQDKKATLSARLEQIEILRQKYETTWKNYIETVRNIYDRNGQFDPIEYADLNTDLNMLRADLDKQLSLASCEHKRLQEALQRLKNHCWCAEQTLQPLSSMTHKLVELPFRGDNSAKADESVEVLNQSVEGRRKLISMTIEKWLITADRRTTISHDKTPMIFGSNYPVSFFSLAVVKELHHKGLDCLTHDIKPIPPFPV